MKYKGFVSGLVVGTLLTAGYSHVSQIDSIERNAKEVRVTIGSAQGSTREDLKAILSRVNHLELEPETDYRFLVGDFDTKDGKSRCGGIAKKVVQYGAEYGFSGAIELERSGLGLHYYATLERDGERYSVEGSPPSLHYRQTE